MSNPAIKEIKDAMSILMIFINHRGLSKNARIHILKGVKSAIDRAITLIEKE